MRTVLCTWLVMEETRKGSLSLRTYFASSAASSTSSSVPSSGVEEPKESDYSSSSDECAGDVAAGPPGKRPKRCRTFKRRWLKEYDWLRYEGSGMFCKPCQESRKKGPFTGTTGCTNYRTSALTRHARSKEHRDALRERVMRKEMITASQRALSENEMAVVSAFRVIYWLAKEEVASSKFPSLINLLKLSGVKCLENLHVGANATYMHHDSFTKMQDVIDECLRDATVEKLHACDAYGLIADESTDIAVTKKLVVYARVVKNCTISTLFLKNIEITDGRAETIMDAMSQWVVENKIGFEKCLGFGSDGASVMVGRKTGVATRMKAVNPFIVSIHCAAHRLALVSSQAAKEIAYMTKLLETLHALYNFFHNSAVRSAKLHAIQDALEEPVRTYKEVFSVRWLSLHDALEAVILTWPSLQTSLENEVASSNNPSAKGLLHDTSQFIFLSTCNFLLDALSVLKKLVKIFQVRDVDFSILKPIVQSAILTLQTQVTTPGPRLASFLVAVGEDKCEEYLNHKICDTQPQRTRFANIREKFTDKLITNLQNRFPEHETDLLNAMVIFDMQQLPTSPSELANSGTAELETLLQHYGEEKNGTAPLVESDACRGEWMLMKQLVSKNYPSMQIHPLWELLYTKYRETFPNLFKLVSAAFAIPVTSADCERGFSTQNRIKRAHRSSLGAKQLDVLMRISIQGPPMEQFDFGKALSIWRKSNHRISL